MSNAGLSFKATVTSGVISTLLAAIATWLFGFWPAIWSFIVTVSNWLWNALWTTVPVPIGLIVVLLALSVFLVRKRTASPTHTSSELIRFASKAVPTGAWSVNPPAAQEPDPLSDSEVTMLRAIAAADGRELPLDELARDSHMSNLAAQQTADHLLSRGYLRHKRDILYGSMLSLSAEGRDFVLSAGYTQ